MPSAERPAASESLVEGQNVSADVSDTAPEIAREESTDSMLPDELTAVIEMVALLSGGKKQQSAASQPSGGEGVINPSSNDKGGSPSVAFLTPFNPDSLDGYTSKLIYSVMDS